jgi:hypothetical protein
MKKLIHSVVVVNGELVHFLIDWNYSSCVELLDNGDTKPRQALNDEAIECLSTIY